MNPKQNQLTLTELLSDTPFDDNSGQIAIQGFEYQHWYATLLITELLASNEDFAVGCEVKEDICVIDSVETPTKIKFVQVKTNEQAVAWTFKKLHAKGKKLRDGTYPLSILAKLFRRHIDFEGHEIELWFVTNSSIKVSDNAITTNVHDMPLTDLEEKVSRTLCKSLASELGVDESKIDLSSARLHTSSLPLGNQKFFISGKLSALVEDGLLGIAITKPSAAAMLLASEVRSRAANTGHSKNFSDLKASRLITRKHVMQTLLQLSNHKSISTVFEEGIQELASEGFNYILRKKMVADKSRLLIAAFDRTNDEFKRQVKAVTQQFANIQTNYPAEIETLGGLIEAVADKVMNEHPDVFTAVEKSYLYALTMVVIHGIEIDVLTVAPGAQSKESQ